MATACQDYCAEDNGQALTPVAATMTTIDGSAMNDSHIRPDTILNVAGMRTETARDSTK